MLGKLVGCPSGGNDTELVDCLRNKPPQDLIDQEWQVIYIDVLRTFLHLTESLKFMFYLFHISVLHKA